ncbi:glycoside hydrolase domain-containing protein [Streptomyces sp. NPDC051582]|uniref:glycoside hydrolase domain-containing protein n=1 Tax=Streptomyces sp. NPDC051582 TaxID=3155167 RepID=UPI0034153CC2
MVPIRTLLSGLLGAALLIPVQPSASADGDADGRTVDYRGMRVTVPGQWRVVDLERNPGACLRLDLPTLYLGHAGTQGECSGRAVRRRADTLHLEPLRGAPARADIPTLTVDGPGGIPAAQGDSREVRYALRGAGVMATVSYGGASDAVRKMLARAGGPAGGTADGRATAHGAASADPVSVDPASAVAGPKPVRAQEPVTGAGFDTCTAPTQGAMDGWRAASPFGAVGIYIGGRARACAQPRLTADWVRRQAGAGWHLMPLWVGPQPWNNPATGLSPDPSRANDEGMEAAEGAVRAARSLGLAEGAVLYNDLENYTDRTTWDPPVVAYLTAWTVRLHELGYRAGAYVAASSGAKALSEHHDQAPEAMPDVLWVASWNGKASVADTDTGLPAGTHRWAGRRRAHQYRGDHDATYAGVTINIDRSWVDVDPGTLGGPAQGRPLFS